MKRMCAFFIAALMLLTAAPLSVPAADTIFTANIIADAELSNGNEFTVKISIDDLGVTDLAYVDFFLKYDETKLDNTTPFNKDGSLNCIASAPAGDWETLSIDEGEGKINCSVFTADSGASFPQKNGDITFEFKFTPKAGASGEIEFVILNDSDYSINGATNADIGTFVSGAGDSLTAKLHNYTATVVKPDCENKGYTLYECTACKHSYKGDYVNAKGHTPGAKATCTTDQLCTVCQKVIASKTGHSYTETTVNPTCSEQGYILHKCKNCSDEYKTDYTDATGHLNCTWTVKDKPSYGVEGLEQLICDKCGTVTDERAIDALDYITGDVNGNGRIDAGDYALTKRFVLKTHQLTAEQQTRADVNGNGRVDAGDYAMIKRHVLGTLNLMDK